MQVLTLFLLKIIWKPPSSFKLFPFPLLLLLLLILFVVLITVNIRSLSYTTLFYIAKVNSWYLEYFAILPGCFGGPSLKDYLFIFYLLSYYKAYFKNSLTLYSQIPIFPFSSMMSLSSAMWPLISFICLLLSLWQQLTFFFLPYSIQLSTGAMNIVLIYGTPMTESFA